MTEQTEPAWTPERTEAALALALEQVPGWIDQTWSLTAAAKAAAPPGEQAAWVQAVIDPFTRDYAALCERMVAHVRADPDQVRRFAEAVAAAMGKRLAELQASATTQEGRA